MNIQKYKEYLEKVGKQNLSESSLSRVWQHVSDPTKSFGVVSPFRNSFKNDNGETINYPDKEKKEINIKNYNKLIKMVGEWGLGYIALKGGFVEDGRDVEERSLFIPNITKKQTIRLGQTFDQYSVIYKDENEFSEIGTSNDSGIGKVIRTFKPKIDNKNFDQETTKKFFSSILKGSHRGRKFVYTEGYVSEQFVFHHLSFNQVAYGKENPEDYIKYITLYKE